jgi:hypothetical protein
MSNIEHRTPLSWSGWDTADVEPPECISSIQVNHAAPETRPTSAGRGWRAVALALASALVVLVGAFAVLLLFGWRFQHSDGQQAASGSSSASAEKRSPPLGPGESAASRVKCLIALGELAAERAP